MKTVLFLCTGNYYRSRYAEILFNAKAEEMGLEWNAVSRGLAPDPRNPGPMFHETIKALQKQGISVENHLRASDESHGSRFRIKRSCCCSQGS